MGQVFRRLRDGADIPVCAEIIAVSQDQLQEKDDREKHPLRPGKAENLPSADFQAAEKAGKDIKQRGRGQAEEKKLPSGRFSTYTPSSKSLASSQSMVTIFR